METKQSNNSATPMADAVKIANQRALFSLEWENDTVFKKRELNYKTKAAFQKDLEAGKISKYTTVFIKDSKEIYKNGQYYGAGSSSVVDISDIYNRLQAIEDGGTAQQEDYNLLRSYISENKLFIINLSGTFIPVDVLYSDTIIGISAYAPFGDIGLACSHIQLSNELNVLKFEDILPYSKKVSDAELTNYSKQESYSSIISSDTINKAIGKLEANVSKIITNGNGTKFLSNDGEYKEIQNKENVVNISDLFEKISSIDDGGKIEQNDYNTLVGYFENGKILIAVNELASSNINYSYAKDGFISLSYQYQYGEIILVCSLFINNDLTIKKYQQIIPSGNGDGTKFLSNDGTYKEIQQGDSEKQSVYINLNNYLSNIGGNGDVNNWSTLKPLLDECCNTESDVEGDKNSGKKQLLVTYYVLPFIRATMSAKNGSEYMLSFTAYGFMLNIIIKDNGSSATYSVNSINIDSSGDGTKYLSDKGSYSKPEGYKIDITDIYKRIDALETGAKIEKDDYDKLRKYTINKNTLFISDISNGCIISDIVYDIEDDNVALRYTVYPYGVVNPIMQLISVGSDLVINKTSCPYCEAIRLEGYEKANNYSPIGVGDSILYAIEKLDAGISYKTLGFEFCSLTESSQLSDVNNSLKQSFSSLEDLYNYISKDGKIKIAYTQTSADCKSDATSSYYSINNGDGSYTRMITISSTCMGFAQNEFGGIIKIQYTVKSGSISSVGVAKKQFQLI